MRELFLLYPLLLSLVMRTSLHSIRSSTITWASTHGKQKLEQTMILTSRRKSSEIVSENLSQALPTPSKQLSLISETFSIPMTTLTELEGLETSLMQTDAMLKSLKSVSTLNSTPLNLPLPNTNQSPFETCREITIHMQAWHLMQRFAWRLRTILGFTSHATQAPSTSGDLEKSSSAQHTEI